VARDATVVVVLQVPGVSILAFEGFHLLFRFLARNPIAFLKFPDQDFTLAFDLIDFIVRQLSPLLANMALKLGPIPLHLIPIDHRSALLVNGGPPRRPEDVLLGNNHAGSIGCSESAKN
jgi:hypothetical protein